MRPTDDPKFRVILASFGEVYSKQVSAPMASLFWEALKDLAIEQVEAGAKAWIKHGAHFPKPADLRKMISEREHAAPKPFLNEREAEEPQDHLLFLANRLFLKHAAARCGLGSKDGIASAESLAARKVVRELVSEFCGYIQEGDEMATPAAFVTVFAKALGKISLLEASTVRLLDEAIASEQGQIPFAPYMGRVLHSRYNAA
jgi:hypothetical protein